MALFSPIALVLAGFVLTATVIGVATVGLVCLHRGRRSPAADAVGFAVVVAPVLAVVPIVVLVLLRWPWSS